MIRNNVFVFVCLLVLSAFVSARPSRVVNVSAENVTDEAATLRADVPATGLAEPDTALIAYLGTRDGGTEPRRWEFSIILGQRGGGVIEIPVEGLKPATTYYYCFRAESGGHQVWTQPATFTTMAANGFLDNTEFLAKLDRKEIPERGFISARPAQRWEEGLLSGNGKMGAVVLSWPLDEKILLTHEKLFLPLNKPLPPIHMAPLLPEIRKAISAGQYERAADLLMAQAAKEGYGSASWTGAFLPALDLILHMDPQGDIKNYRRSEDFSTGVTAVRWDDARGSFSRRLFVSRADNVVVLSLKGSRKGALNLDLRLQQRALEKVNSWGVQENVARGLKRVTTGATAGCLTYDGTLADGTAYRGVARVVATGGRLRPDGSKLRVENADDVLVLLRIEPSSAGTKTDVHTLQVELEKVPPSFETLLDQHTKVHGEIFNRAKLDLNGGRDRYLPIEQLKAKSSVHNVSPALLEKVFDAGRYTILSATGEWPPNLQGKWNGTWGPAWSGGYTMDGNAATAVASMMNGNMPELMLSLFGFVEGMMPAMRENARAIYGARGILMPVQVSTSGFHNHFSKEYPLAFWTAGAGWIAHYYYDYYLYTGDRAFLAKRALPFMKEAALFYQDFLTEGSDGKYVFNPSYSPENTPRNGNSQAAINATMDIAVARELLSNLVDGCETLNIEQGQVVRWKQMLSKLPEYTVNSDGALKEWTWPTLEDQYGHRHLSHLYPLFFGMPSDVARDPKLLAAFRRAAERRIEWRASKGGGEMAFGMVQLGEVEASVGDGDAAYSVVAGLTSRNYYSNLMSSHDPGPSIFNADISGGLPDVVIRMLVQSKAGRIDLLPALPKQLLAGEIDRVLAKGEILVKQLKWAPSECRVVLNSRKDQTVTVSVPAEIASIKAGSDSPIQHATGTKEVQVVLPANVDVELTLNMK